MSRNLSATGLSNELIGTAVLRPQNDSVLNELSGSQLVVATTGIFTNVSDLTPASMNFARSVVTTAERKSVTRRLAITPEPNTSNARLEAIFPPPAVAANGALVFPAASGFAAISTTAVPLATATLGGGNNDLAAIFTNPANPNQLVAYQNYPGNGSATQAYQISTDNGLTWAGSLTTGLTIFYGQTGGNTAAINLVGTSSQNHYSGNRSGYRLQGQSFYNNAVTYPHWIFNFGARIIRISSNPGQAALVASSSTDGINGINTDASTAVLGAANVPPNSVNYFYAYRNGNSGFFAIASGITRFTTDGGATWANSTNAFGNPAISYLFKVNGSDPAKLIATAQGSTTAFTTANTGGSFTGRTLLFGFGNSSNDSIAYVGNIGAYVDFTNRRLYVTTDNFATSSLIANSALGVPNIPGVTGRVICVVNDSSRIYALFTSNQIAQTTDGVTWTVRNVIGVASSVLSTVSGSAFAKIGNTGFLLASNGGASGVAFVTTDDAVTWSAGLLLPQVEQPVSSAMTVAVGTQSFHIAGQTRPGGSINSGNGSGQGTYFFSPTLIDASADGAAVQISGVNASTSASSPISGLTPYIKVS